MTHRTPTAEEVDGVHFRTSSYSGSGGNECVEVGNGAGWVGVRDTKNRHAGMLVLSEGAFGALLGAVRDQAL
ncbi:DUF397 domain-containing protein [Streptomyces sp. NPDC001108]